MGNILCNSKNIKHYEVNTISPNEVPIQVSLKVVKIGVRITLNNGTNKVYNTSQKALMENVLKNLSEIMNKNENIKYYLNNIECTENDENIVMSEDK